MSLKRNYKVVALAGRASPGALIAAAGLLTAGLLTLAGPAMAADAAPASGDSNTVEEVVITATKREEALQNVPIAVTAISGEKARAAHIGNFSDLPMLTPGANFVSTKGPSTANVAIRGQGATNDAPALELPVAVFMDDIYYGSLASFSADFYDIGQIAILRGPQGTTFGRNVVGGALQITSNKAQLGFDGGQISGTVSGYPEFSSMGFESQGYVNHAFGEDLAGRVAFSVKNVGGYMHNRVTGHNLSNIKSVGIRPSFRWEPNDSTSVVGFLNYFHEDSYAAGYKALGQGSVVATEQAAASSPWDVFHNVDGKNRRTIWAGQLKVDKTRSYGTWSFLTSYRTLDSYYQDDGDNTPKSLNDNKSINASNEWQFSEEVRLTSNSGQKLEYVGGLYYSFENLRKQIAFAFDGTDPTSQLSVFTGGTLQRQVVTGDAHVISLAPFGEAKWHITDQWALTFGARYTFEEKHAYTDHTGSSPFYGAGFNASGLKKRWTAFTPRVILEFKPQEHLMFYGGVSTGFKGGGWSLTSTSLAKAQIPLQPETSISYEAGAKTLWFDKRLLINVAVYQADTKHLQVRSLVAGVLTDSNAGSERVKGVELETLLKPVSGLTLGLNYAYNDAKYSDFKDCLAHSAALPNGLDCTGNTVPFTPKNDLTLSVEYRYDLAGGGSLLFHVDDQWASQSQVSPQNTNIIDIRTGAAQAVVNPRNQPIAVPFTEKKGILNAQLTYEAPSHNWTLQLWGKNLTNQWYMVAPSNYYFYFLTPLEARSLALGGNGYNEVERGVINPPRQVGLTLTYKFD
jgi:iron complex outermembrane receptor protein